MRIELDEQGAGTLRTIAEGEPVPPVALVHRHEVKALAGIDSTDDDQLLDRICLAAERSIADYCGIAIRRTRWQATIEDPERRVTLPGPVLAVGDVSAVERRDRVGDPWTALGSTDYEVRLRRAHPAMPAVVDLVSPSCAWLRVTWERGWSYHPDRPESLRHAARALAGELYSSSELVTDARRFTAGTQIPLSVAHTLQGYRLGGAR